MFPSLSRPRRPSRRPLLCLFALLVPGAAPVAAAAGAPRDACVVATITSGEDAPAARLRALAVPGYWIEAGRELLLCARGGAVAVEELAAAARVAGALEVALLRDVDPARLAFLRETREVRGEALGRVLVRSARHAVVELAPDLPEEHLAGLRRAAAARAPGPDLFAPALFPFEPDRVLARRSSRAARGRGEALTDPQIGAFLDEIDIARWFEDVSTLAAWNRWTRGPQVLSARDWLVSQFSALDGFTVTTGEFWVPPNSWPGAWAYNVIATVPGSSRPDEWYIVGGHYDSTSNGLPDVAPGADDNASGCAGTLELARLFAAHPPDATMIFICFSGEEQGLYGSDDYVADLYAAGDLGRVQGAYILDMIAYAAGPSLNVILEAETFAQPWMNQFADAAVDFTTLDNVYLEYGTCCSDHHPFLHHPNQPRPAVLAIEADYPYNPNYHTTNDLPGYLSPALAEQVLRMGGGGLLRLAGSTTIFVDGFESGGALRWSSLVPIAP